VNYSDPFGLCVKEDVNCHALVKLLRAQEGSEFKAAAKRYDNLKVGRVHFVDGSMTTDRWGTNVNRDGDPDTWVGGWTRGGDSDVYLNGEASRGDFLLFAVHESLHLANQRHGAELYHTMWKAYNQLSRSDMKGAVRHSDQFYHFWGAKYAKHPVPGTEPKQ
jgi:hypothetical protein